MSGFHRILNSFAYVALGQGFLTDQNLVLIQSQGLDLFN